MNWEVLTMKSRTSSSKFTVFRKELTRFAPVWLAWCAMYLLGGYLCYDWQEDLTYNYSPFLSLFNLTNIVYGFACAACLFGYLHDSRECNTVHAFPYRREEYFLIHLLSGLVMSFVPAAVFCLAILPITHGNLLMLFLGMQFQFLFYFALAVFCMMLTGRRFAAGVLYGLLNFIAPLLYLAIDILYIPYLPGIVLEAKPFLLLCPLFQLMFSDPQQLEVWYFGKDQIQLMTTCVTFAGVGVVLIALSLLLYRRRRLENAGNFLAFKCLEPVFVLVVTVVFGCFAALFGRMYLDNDWILLAIFLIIGYFAALMMLKRSIRVFYVKSIVSMLALMALIFGSLLLTTLDPLNRIHYVPDADQVAAVTLCESAYYRNQYRTTDLAEITDIADIHRELLETGDFHSDSAPDSLKLTYEMKDGRRIVRNYQVDAGAANVMERVNYYRSQPEYLIGTENLEDLLKRFTSCSIYSKDGSVWYDLEEDQAEEFLSIFYAEAQEGKMYYPYYLNQSASYELVLTLYSDSGVSSYYLYIPDTAVKTLEWICENVPAA